MQETKLTVRVPRELLENVKRYAAENNTTLTDLIEAYLRRIPSRAIPGECSHCPQAEWCPYTGRDASRITRSTWKRNMAGKPTVLIDLNILLDVLQKREPFYATSAGLLAAVETGKVQGYVAAHSITTLFYLIQKGKSSAEARATITNMLQVHQNCPGRSKHH